MSGQLKLSSYNLLHRTYYVLSRTKPRIAFTPTEWHSCQYRKLDSKATIGRIPAPSGLGEPRRLSVSEDRRVRRRRRRAVAEEGQMQESHRLPHLQVGWIVSSGW